MKMRSLFSISIFCVSAFAVADISDTGTNFVVSSPESMWELQFPEGNWELKKNSESKKEATYEYFFGSSRKSVTQLSIKIEPTVSCKTSGQCREEHWKMASLAMTYLGSAPTDIRMAEVNNFSVVRFFQNAKVEGKIIKILNHHAIFVKDSIKVWINIVGLIRAPEDELALDELMKEFQIKDKR